VRTGHCPENALPENLFFNIPVRRALLRSWSDDKLITRSKYP
jgi:hypothetical protein